MASPLKRRNFYATVDTMAGAARVRKTFINDEARQRYSSYFSHHPFTTTRTIDFEFFNKAGIDSFKKFEQIG